MNWYNDNDAYCAAWLGNLMTEGLIPDGEVDARPIQDVRPEDLTGFRQCHFFAGIAGWSLALRLAGWPEDREVWTGSCPCQPFSQAGKRKGTKDERHLWPVWRELVAERRPPVILGEQVASPLGREWVAGVRFDLEALGYEVGIADLCTASAGAPHIRQRVWWVADSRQHEARRNANSRGEPPEARTQGQGEIAEQPTGHRQPRRMGDASEPRGGRDAGAVPRPQAQGSREGREAGDIVDEPIAPGEPRFWDAFDIVHCADGKARRVEPKYVAVVDGLPGRVGPYSTEANKETEEVDATKSIKRNGRRPLRMVRQDAMQTQRPPQGRKPYEQRRDELADFVLLLPRSLALAQLHGDTATTEALRTLLEASGAERLLQYPSEQIQEAWRSLSRETRKRFGCMVREGSFVRTCEFPLAHGVPARVGKLRAYGNAVVSILAATFVRAYLEATEEAQA